MSRDPGAHNRAILPFAWAEEGRRRSRDAGKAGGDRKSRILELMFPGRFEEWLEQYLSDLPLVRGSESHIAPERLGGAWAQCEHSNVRTGKPGASGNSEPI